MHIPAFKGNRPSLSWLPPSGKIPIHSPWLNCFHTDS
jgi:hypothetical protein